MYEFVFEVLQHSGIFKCCSFIFVNTISQQSFETVFIAISDQIEEYLSSLLVFQIGFRTQRAKGSIDFREITRSSEETWLSTLAQ